MRLVTIASSTPLAAIALGLCVVAGCAGEVPPASRPDSGPGADVGTDASELDAGTDANDLDAHDLDAHDLDAHDLDASDLDAHDVDANDAFVPIDIGPFDAAITRTSDPPTHPSATPIAPFTTCTVTTFTDTIEGAEHRTPCEAIPYPYYPPSAGPHYSIWASFQTYDAPVPWGFLVHDLEHGALVLAYHCANDADCNPVRTEMASIVAARGLDPVCRLDDTNTRFIVVSVPDLPVPIAAIAWRHVYEASCLDPASLRVHKQPVESELSWVILSGAGQTNVHRSLDPRIVTASRVGPDSLFAVAPTTSATDTDLPGTGRCFYYVVYGRASCSGGSVVP